MSGLNSMQTLSDALAGSTPELMMKDQDIRVPPALTYETLSIDTRHSSSQNFSALQKLKAENPQDPRLHVIRTDFARSAGKATVLTNHFALRLNDLLLWHFEVKNFPRGSDRHLKRRLIERLIMTDQHFVGRRDLFATNFLNTIITWNADGLGLNVRSRDAVTQCTVQIPDPRTKQSQTVTLELVAVAKHTHEQLNDFIKGKPRLEDATRNVLQIRQAISLVLLENLRHAYGSSLEMARVGPSMFVSKRGYAYLGKIQALVAIRGYELNLAPGQGHTFVCLSTVNKAFFPAVTVQEFINRFAPFADENADQDNVLRRLRVYVQFPSICGRADDEQTITKVGENVSKQACSLNGKRVDMRTYLASTFPGLDSPDATRCIKLGTDDNAFWYPADKLRILPYQRFPYMVPSALTDEMLNFACRAPRLNKELLLGEGLRALGFKKSSPGADPILQAAAGQILVNGRMVEVPATCLPRPTIEYVKKMKTPNERAQWNLADIRFNLMPILRPKVYAFIASPFESRHHAEYLNAFRGEMKNYGFTDVEPCGYTDVPRGSNAPQQCRLAMQMAKKTGSNLVLVILPDKSAGRYDTIKSIADREFGIPTVCVVKETLEKNRKQSGRPFLYYMANIAMKVSLKCGGSNHRVRDLGRPNMAIFGADTTHCGGVPLPGMKDAAALVGSVDAEATNFSGSARLNPLRQEIIEDIKDMARERLIAYVNAQPADRQALPQTLVYFRDGVGVSQYSAVRIDEVSKIRAAWLALKKERASPLDPPNVRITVIIVTKRQSKRLYPIAAAGPQANCPPGTLVDSSIMSSYTLDWLLISHHALQGTAKPALYTVLEDENNFTVTELQDLSFKLCYNYARATMGVSYASPAYYADRLCERLRCYIRRFLNPTALERGMTETEVEQQLRRIWTQAQNPNGPWSKELNDTMFWL